MCEVTARLPEREEPGFWKAGAWVVMQIPAQEELGWEITTLLEQAEKRSGES